MGKRIWITWENQRRNRELSRELKAELFELKEIDQIKNPTKKYLTGIVKTSRIVLRRKPSLIFCQNPSLILAAFLVFTRGLGRFKVVVDAHNAGLFPMEGRSAVLGALTRYIQKRADLTLVTNIGLKEHVEKNGGRAFILQDRIPAISLKAVKRLAGEFNILFICSYGADEPYELVFEAAKLIDGAVHIYVTGNYRKRNIDPSEVPGNVTLLGYVSEDEYVDMLNSVDATMDMTTRENCLVCGAYETVAVEKPQILSDTRALREYFRKGVVYTPHSPQSIADAIHKLIGEQEKLKQETRELKQELQEEWEGRRLSLEQYLAGLCGAPKVA